MIVKFEGTIRSKGTIPKGVKGFWRRLFAKWDKSFPVLWEWQSDDDLRRTFSFNPFGVPFVFYLDSRDSIAVKCYMAGALVIDETFDVHEELRVKYSKAGQSIEGLLTIEA